MIYYRKCSAVFLKKPFQELYFSAERIDCDGAWQIPQGGVDDGEDYLTAGYRELYEETGINSDSVKFIKNTASCYKYDFTEKIRLNMQDVFRKNFKGQSVKFFLFEFIGDEQKIDLSFSKHREFKNWKWMPAKELIDSMIEFKKQAFLDGATELGIL